MKKHMTKKKPVIIAIILFLALTAVGATGFCLLPVSFGGQYPERLEALAADTLLTKEQVAEDRDLAIQFVEDVHPYFVVEEDLTAYGQARQMDGDIFVVNFVECVDDENLKSIVGELEKAVKQGCNKVIIDARGNGGGNSNACERLLEAMEMKAPGYDMLIRFSDEAKEQIGYLRSSGTYRWKGSSKCMVNDNIQLVILCDRYTFYVASQFPHICNCFT